MPLADWQMKWAYAVQLAVRVDTCSAAGKKWLDMQVAKSRHPLKAAQENILEPVAKNTARRAQGKERSKEDIWAEEGIEQMAGKSWLAMEAERQAQQKQQIAARVQAALMGPSVSSYPFTANLTSLTLITEHQSMIGVTFLCDRKRRH